MLFKSQTKQPKFQVLMNRAFIPEIRISQTALSKMQLYVQECKDEIGWLATATRDGNVITIEDTLLLEQEVHATTTEITVDGLSKLAEELLVQPDGIETWNNIKVWGHSHVNMDTSPSGQDEKQMEVFEESGHDWFIRLIANKKGDVRVDFYNFEHGMSIQAMSWEAEEAVDSEEIAQYTLALGEYERKIMELEETREALLKAIESEQDKHVTELKPVIAEEMKAKVKKKQYNYTKYKGGAKGTQSFRGSENYPGSYGYWQGQGAWHDQADEWGDYYFERDNPSPYQGGPNFVFLDDRFYQAQTFSPELVDEYFDSSDIAIIAKIQTLTELADYFEDCGYTGSFTKEEAEYIWRFAKRGEKTHV